MQHFCAMNGTYTIVRKPFQVLFTIHVCLKTGHFRKQVPKEFTLISHVALLMPSGWPPSKLSPIDREMEGVVPKGKEGGNVVIPSARWLME